MAEFWNLQRTTGALMVAAWVPLVIGVGLFLSRGGTRGGEPRSAALFAIERGSLVTAVVLTALAFVLLNDLLQETDGRILARLGTAAFFFGAVVLVAAEASGIAEGRVTYPPVVVYVVMAFIGQAVIGGALLQAGLLPAWIGWTTVAWNAGLLVILAAVTPGDMYYPVQHHVMPLLIGIGLLLGSGAG